MAKVGNVGLGFGAGSGEIPQAPNTPIVSVVAGDSTLTVTIDGDGPVTHILTYKPIVAAAWIIGGTRVGDGSITVANLTIGTYHVQAYSSNAGVYSTPSKLLVISILDSETDPISKAHDALWELLEGSGDFTNLVAKGNRVKFAGNSRAPMKEQAITADYPQVRIVAVSSEPHSNRTSNGSSLKKRFAVQILTGDQRLTEVLFPLEWIIYRTMSKGISTLNTLMWRNHAFIKNVKPIAVADQLFMDGELRPTILGWTSVWQVEIEMWFTTADLE